jgi:hypothetical protein
MPTAEAGPGSPAGLYRRETSPNALSCPEWFALKDTALIPISALAEALGVPVTALLE